MKRRIITAWFLNALMVFLPVSCDKTRDGDGPESRMEKTVFSVCLEDADEVVATKSLLPATSVFENMITSVSIGVYQDGSIADRCYYTASFDAMSFTIDRSKGYNVYVVANMGDMRSVFPSSEADVAGLAYTIPAYTGSSSNLETRGIPMCGSAVIASGTSEPGTILLRRLLAKVTANISCSWSGARVSTVKVYNLNGKLLPFAQGGSRAASAADILSVQEYSAGTNVSSGSFVFYVPENMQGTVSGITNSSSKSPDYNATVNSRKGYLTYIETHVEGSGKYSGYIDYRSFLGSNSTTNFDIIRNKGYVWNLTFTEDGIQVSDWKHGNFLSWNEYRYSLSKSSMTLNVGASDTFQVWRYTDVYTAGSKTSTGTTPEPVAVSELSYTSASGSIASVSASGSNSLAVTGVAQGSTTINVSVAGNSLHLPVTVSDVVSHRLELTASPASTTYNGNIQLSAKYYTTTNGHEDSGVPVTPNAFTKTSGGLNITIESDGRAHLTTPSASIEANNRATVTASYLGETSNSVNIEFTNVTTYEYTRLVVTGDAIVRVGSNTSNYGATLYTITRVNGVQVGSATQSSVTPATISSSNASIATNATGYPLRMRGVAAGSVDISGTYTGTYGSISTADADRLTLSVKNVYTVSVSPTSATLVVGNTQTFTATVRRNGTVMSAAQIAAEGVLSWESSNTSYATINSSGQITGVAAGSVTVTLRFTPTGDSAVTATASVTVVPSSGGNMDTGWDEGGEIEL